jgi:Raf kinase inhibitor-like YbhB/YbcL family protein
MMRITSSAFTNDSDVPVRYTCAGPNINPPLAFIDVPASATSLVLIVEDIDATPVPWVHWLVFNIPPHVKGTEEGALPPAAVEGLANGGTPGYEGPCPKYFTGVHHYRFLLIALDKQLDLPATSNIDAVRAAMQGHIVDTAALVGLQTGTASSAV